MSTVQKPICGTQGDSTDSLFKTFLAILMFLSGLIGAVKLIFDASLHELLVGILTGILGTAVPAAVAFVAVAAAVVTVLVIFTFYYAHCLEDPDGLQACSAGVVQNIVPSFSEHPENDLFPFTAVHDRVDVVVKSAYWFLVQQNAALVKCNTDAAQSPILQGFYYSNRVCAAALGSFIGGLVGAVPGILLGALLGALLCTTVILCIFALLLAAIIAIVSVLAGAYVGGHIAKSFGADIPPTAGLSPIQIGDYVSTCGKLITSGEFDGARVYWFVEKGAAHGRSLESPPYSFRDPDANLQPDTCQSDPDFCPTKPLP